jgi:hypothetical protein
VAVLSRVKVGNSKLDGCKARLVKMREAVILAAGQCLLVTVGIKRIDAAAGRWWFSVGALRRHNGNCQNGMGATELGRVPSKFLASSILTTFAHLSFHKNGHAGKSGSWSRGSSRSITCINVCVAMLPIA